MCPRVWESEENTLCARMCITWQRLRGSQFFHCMGMPKKTMFLTTIQNATPSSASDSPEVRKVFGVCWITSQLSYSWAAGLMGECDVCLYVHVIYTKCDATQKSKRAPHQEQPAQQNRVGVTLQEIHLMQNYMFQHWEHFKTFGSGLAYLLMRSKEKTLCFCFIFGGFFFLSTSYTDLNGCKADIGYARLLCENV